MKTWLACVFALVLLLTSASCSELPLITGSLTQSTQGASTPVVSPTTSLIFATGTPNSTASSGGTPNPSTPASGLLVRVWVPPEFDPNGNRPASSLLKARLEQFGVDNPDVRIEVREKALEGTGGLLDSLVAANVAAPLALPDLVLLPRPLLESATLKGLLYPYDHLTGIMDDPAWFGYAHQLSQLQSSTYGIPFAGDALLMVYHPSLMSVPPATLKGALSLGAPFLYPATDPQAIFSLNSYLAGGGKLQDEQGRPYIDETTLTRLLEYDQQASQAGVMPYWLTQYSTDDQVWEAFLSNPYPMAATWASSYLGQAQAGITDLGIAPVPTASGSAFSLATGWCWALAGQDPERRTAAVRLAEYLADKDFMAQYTQAAGYLPPRADALGSWPNNTNRQVVEQISASAVIMPPVDMLETVGPPLEQAVVAVLKAQSDPQTAAKSVVDQVNQP